MKKNLSGEDQDMMSAIIKLAVKFLKLEGREFSYRQIKSRYPSMRFLIGDISSYILALIGSRYSSHPFAIAIEPLNSCNLSCAQCEVNRGMKRPKGIMEFEMLRKIIDENRYTFRVNLTNYGEPLLHKDILKMINYISSKRKVCTIFTNGTLLTENMMTGLVESGLNVASFSIDGLGEMYEKIRGWSYGDVEKKITRFIEINKARGKPVWTEVNMVDFEQTSGGWPEVLGVWRNRVDVVMKTPLMQAGKRTRRCFGLWRTLSIMWDGTVVPCCVDREAELKLGNIKDSGLREIFNGNAMRELRKRHIKGDYPFICSNCNEFFG